MATDPKARITSESDSASIATELSSRRTGMSFQRTRMSADRTLMSVIRTSLSLIGFGFTIFQVFQKLHETRGAEEQQGGAPLRRCAGGARRRDARRRHRATTWSYMVGLRRERLRLKADGLIHAESRFPVSLTLIVAVLLLGIGFLAITSMVFGVGPFG